MSDPEAVGLVDTALAAAARQEGGRIVALLAGQFRDLDLADEAVQDALEEAVRVWPERGVPANPGGWLLTVARRKAIDRTRRAASAQRRLFAAAPELVSLSPEPEPTSPEPEPTSPEPEPTSPEPVEGSEPVEEERMTLDHAGIRDDQLRLILLCCHPALDREAQVALTLRLVGGLTTPEIAAAFLIPEATLAQRIVRAKRKIKAARIPLTIPAAVDDRVATVLRVLYLVFNEGYLTHGSGGEVVRIDLVDEAIRLTNLMVALVPADAEVKGLLALELYHRARIQTRVDRDGDLVLLEDQDRSRWNLAEITLANRVLADAVREGGVGPFRLQAAIAGYHANARTAVDTNWPAIVAAYDQLVRLDPSPVVALNRAAAVGMADGPRLGLALLDEITGLDGYHLFHAARGELLRRSGAEAAAVASFRRARALTSNPAEQRHLDRRIGG